MISAVFPLAVEGLRVKYPRVGHNRIIQMKLQLARPRTVGRVGSRAVSCDRSIKTTVRCYSTMIEIYPVQSVGMGVRWLTMKTLESVSFSYGKATTACQPFTTTLLKTPRGSKPRV